MIWPRSHTWPTFVAYLVSFFVVGVIWVNHHALFMLIERVDRVLLFENLLLLMRDDVAFHHSHARGLPAGGRCERPMGGSALRYLQRGDGLLVHRATARMTRHGLLRTPVPADVAKRAIRRFGTIAYPIATALGLIWPPLVLVAMALLTVYYMSEHTPILPTTTAAP